MKIKTISNIILTALLMITSMTIFSSCGKTVEPVKAPAINVTTKASVTTNIEEDKGKGDSLESDKENKEKPKSSSGVEKPAPNVYKTIVIDPGHAKHADLEKEKLSPNSDILKIKDGGGATGIVTKMPEYVLNFKIASYLREILQGYGYIVVMTKEDMNLSLGNIDRAIIGNKEKASLVVRVHADSSENSSADGATMLIPDPLSNTKYVADESKRCGNIILDTLVKEVNMKNRGLSPRSDMTGFNFSEVPVVLVEVGFLSNEREDRLLSTDQYQKRIAQALADGIKSSIN